MPKLIRSPKWFKSETDLEIGDLVYFQRTANELGSKYGRWVIGRVAELERGGDSVIRRVWVTYKNAGEDILHKTERSIRSLIKLFSITDSSIQEDLSEVQKVMMELLGANSLVDVKVNVHGFSQVMDAVSRSGSCSIDWCQTEVQAYVADHSKEDLVHGDTCWGFHEDAS